MAFELIVKRSCSSLGREKRGMDILGRSSRAEVVNSGPKHRDLQADSIKRREWQKQVLVLPQHVRVEWE